MQMKTFFKEIPTLIPREKLPYAHKLAKKIILVQSTSKCPDRRKTETFCKKVGTSKGSEYFRRCEGILNSFFSQPLQQQLSREIQLNLKEKPVVAGEIGNLLKKVAIEKVHMKKVSAKSQFLSNLFLVKKNYGGNRPVISLKNLNQYVPHHHFKTESLQSLI